MPCTGEDGLPPEIWAVVPVKELHDAKHRLASLLTPTERRALAEIMLGEVLDTLAAVRGLAGILLVTLEPVAIAWAEAHGARITDDGARANQTGAVAAAQRLLASERVGGMITLPGDVPAATPAEVEAVLAAHRPAPSFTIAPAHDDLGSNAVLLSPPDGVTLRFGDNSFFPHLDAARRGGIEPTVVRCPGIAMDIDHPVDLGAFLRLPQSAGTRTRGYLEEIGVPQRLARIR
jgi:2-phospho-L-lactate/phosphoenolpyruvate guanylyltransferase